MKTKQYFLLLWLFILSSCYTETDDYISKYCPGSCTVIKGKLTTDGGTKPLAGVKLDLNWSRYEFLGGEKRRKAITTTDDDGNYELRFLQRDDELAEGDFNVEAHLPKENYFFCYNSNEIGSYFHLKRDTTITLNYELPQIAYIKVQPTNVQAMQPNDYFDTEFIFSAPCTPVFVWRSTSTLETGRVGANQQVIIRSTRIKAGTRSVTEETVTLRPGEVYTYQVTF